MSGSHIGAPGVHCCLQSVDPMSLGVNTVVPAIEGDRLGDVAVAKSRQGLALLRVALAAVLPEAMDRVRVPSNESPEGAAGPTEPIW